MSDELAEAAFLACVPRVTDELARAVRDRKYAEARELAEKLNRGFGLVAECMTINEEKRNARND